MTVLSIAGLTAVESMSMVVIVATLSFVSYHYRHIPIGGRGVPLTGSLSGSSSQQRPCGPDCAVCPHCDAENASSYTYCHNCARRV